MRSGRAVETSTPEGGPVGVIRVVAVAPRGDGAAALPALATLHPAYLLRNPAAKKDAWHDLLLLRRRLDAGG